MGCADTVSNKLIVLSDVLNYIPNSFTPDGDENNQVWSFKFNGIEEDGFNMYVFNRWGQVIWESHDVNSYWDGTYNGIPVQQGSYVWKADFDVLNTSERRVISGMVTILK